MLIRLHRNIHWIDNLVPTTWHVRRRTRIDTLTDFSAGEIAGLCYWVPPNTLDEINSVSQRYRDVIVYVCEPWGTMVGDTNFLDTFFAADWPNVTMYADILFDQTRPNYKQINNWFMEWDQLYHNCTWAPDLIKACYHPELSSKPYRFDALLGRRRPNKQFVYDQWQQSSFKQHILLTYYDKDVDQGIWDYDYTKTETGFDDGITMQWTHMPAGGNHKYLVYTPNLLPVSIYKSSWYSIIAEGFINPCGTRLTEKTAKALISGRLFVYFGAVNDLRRLRSLGFQTFDGIINENYDNIFDNELRWQMAWQQVEYLCTQDPVEIQQASKDIREHNQRVFLTTDWFAPLRQHVKDLFDK